MKREGETQGGREQGEEEQREREKEKDLPSADSCHKWLQWAGLGQAKAQNQNLHSVSHVDAKSQDNQTIFCCFSKYRAGVHITVLQYTPPPHA